jgi:Rod binding domain-containing protein
MDVLATLPGMALTPAQQTAMKAPATRDGDQRQIEKVAKGLESMFFSILCKEMRETLEPGTLFGGDQGDVFGGMFDQFMGEHLAQGGSLGIAAMVRKQLTAQAHNEKHPGKPAAPAGRIAVPPLS